MFSVHQKQLRRWHFVIFLLKEYLLCHKEASIQRDPKTHCLKNLWEGIIVLIFRANIAKILSWNTVCNVNIIMVSAAKPAPTCLLHFRVAHGANNIATTLLLVISFLWIPAFKVQILCFQTSRFFFFFILWYEQQTSYFTLQNCITDLFGGGRSI